ncbi:MAG: hypothetical protein ACE5EA_05435 [Nitrospirota bacterium]
MNAVREVADIVHFMNAGKILSSGTPEEVLNNPGVREVYIGV